jgi:hypothetical protein
MSPPHFSPSPTRSSNEMLDHLSLNPRVGTKSQGGTTAERASLSKLGMRTFGITAPEPTRVIVTQNMVAAAAVRDEGIRERLFWVKAQRWADKMKVHLSRLCRSSAYFRNVPNSDIPQTLMSRHPNSTP